MGPISSIQSSRKDSMNTKVFQFLLSLHWVSFLHTLGNDNEALQGLDLSLEKFIDHMALELGSAVMKHGTAKHINSSMDEAYTLLLCRGSSIQ